MTRQNIYIGASANDGSGDTLRSGGNKMNQNFVELYQNFGTDSNNLNSGITFTASAINIAGNGNTRLTRIEPTSDTIISLPDSTGEVVIINSNNEVYLDNNLGQGSKLYFSNRFDSVGDLPDASKWHGMFAHTHLEQAAHFAHSSSWHVLLDSDTFSSRTDLQLINPKMDTTIFDNTGTFEILQLDNVSTGNTSYVKLTNASDSNPSIEMQGTSADIGLDITMKGTEPLTLNGAMVYGTETYTASADLDSGASTYLFNIPGARTFTLHNGRYVGEMKHLINRTVETVTIDAGANRIRRPGNNTFQNMVIGDVNFVTMMWDGFAWIVDRDSDKYITFS